MWVGDGPIGQGQPSGRRRLLLVDGSGDRPGPLRDALLEHGWEVHTAEGARQLREVLAGELSAVACRVDRQHRTDLAVLDAVHSAQPDLPVVCFTCGGGIQEVSQRWRQGAFDVVYAPNDCPVDLLVESLERAHAEHRTRLEVNRLREEEQRQMFRGLQRQRVELRHARKQQLGALASLQLAREALEEDSRLHQQLEDTLTTEQARLAQAARATAELLRDLGAEIQGPLETILGAVEGLLDDEADVRVCQQALEICGAARSLSSTVRDVMELAALEDGTHPVRPCAVDMLAFLAEWVDHVHHLADDLDISLQVQAGVGAAWVDPDRLRDALIQLLLAVGRPPEERLDIAAWVDGRGVRLRLAPVRVGPGTWRAAELLRWLGGTLTAGDDVLEVGLRTVHTEVTVFPSSFQPPKGRLDTVELTDGDTPDGADVTAEAPIRLIHA